MNTNESDLKEKLKKRLFESISAQIDTIAYVPNDLAKLVGCFEFDRSAVGSSHAQDLHDGSRAEHEPAAPGDGVDKDTLARKINNYYDEAFYNRHGIMGILLGENEFRNIGYWGKDTPTQTAAAERLQDALLAFIPEKSGRILDVACGLGASTRRLLNYYSPDNIWAINISEKQIDTTKKNAPGCHARVMNAVDMAFEDEFFANILCIEAAFHFETRRKFLEEAHRVLELGGRLVMSDVLFTSKDRLEQYAVFPSPENHLATADEYRTLLSDVGFRNIVVDDVSKDVWNAHFMHVVNLVHEKFLEGELDIVHLTEILWAYYQLNAVTGPCLFICAQK